MTVAPREFAIDALRCRWQAMPTMVRAQDSATLWLRGIAGDAVAEGLHRDARDRPRLAQGDIGWSHSHGRLLVAYTERGSVGVDIESTLRRTDPLRIARRFFSQEEIAALEALDGDARHRAFLRLWCAKEALLKAHGHGLAFGLDKLTFAIAGDALRLIRCDPALGDAGAWTLHECAPEPGFIAVLATHL